MDTITAQIDMKHLLSASGKTPAAPLAVELQLCALHTPAARRLVTPVGYLEYWNRIDEQILFPWGADKRLHRRPKNEKLEEDSLNNGFFLLLHLPLLNILFPDSSSIHSCLGVCAFLKVPALEVTYDE